MVASLTPDRLSELRRIAEAATPGPWAWRMSKDGRILDLITLETGYNEEIITPSHLNAWLQVKGGLQAFIPAFDPTTALALLDRIEALERERDAARGEAERWRKKYEALWAGVERVADDLQMAADEAHDNWRITADFNEQGRSIGLEEAEQMVRRVLSEPGGGDT